MLVEDQSDVVAFLSAPGTHSGAEVEHFQTHISEVFLAGEHAYKLKRAVKLPYVDYSTLPLRREACDKEIALNRLTAPDLYLGVRLITREADGTLAFDGAGAPVDAVVEMRRFDQAGLFDRMAVEGRLDEALMEKLGRAIARFHDAAPAMHTGGGYDNLRGVLEINAAGFATSHVFDKAEVAELQALFESRLADCKAALDRREAAGRVRRCHGDLHLRNICLIDGEPVIFDCIEFNDQLATTDVLYDLAFLLMDLWHRDLKAMANRVANHYFDEIDEDEDYALLPVLMAIRAAVRAHVTATQCEDATEGREALIRSARSYFDLARELLEPFAPSLVTIGGLSGTGKTTIAEALAPGFGPPPGARLFESDRIRKSLFGVPAEEKLPPTAYEPGVNERVYDRLAEHSVKVAKAGCHVVANAVYSKPAERVGIAERAEAAEVPFTGIWLEAPADVLHRRVEDREKGASDATVDILDRQLHYELGEIDWVRVKADRPVEDIVADLAFLASDGGPG